LGVGVIFINSIFIMKKTIFLLLVAILFTSCGGYKKINKKTTKQSIGDGIIYVHCSGSDYESDKKYFRANQSSKSSDLSMAREKSLTMAKRRLASNIQTVLKSVTERYANDRQIDDKSEFTQKYENMTREVVQRQLIEVKIICQKTSQTPDGNFMSFTAVEVDKDVIYSSVKNAISKNVKLQQDFEEYKFSKTFEEEMDKYSKENQY